MSIGAAVDAIGRKAVATAEKVEEHQRALDGLSQWLNRQDEQRRRQEQNDQRSQEMINAQAMNDMRVRYDPIFETFGQQTPQPSADDTPASFQKHLMRSVQQKLSPSDERRADASSPTTVADLAKVPLDNLPRTARHAVESSLLSAAQLQAQNPHFSTLPPSGFVTRHNTDPETGKRVTSYFGRQSFIKDFSTPARRVHRILNQKTGHVLFGPPFPRIPD
jgi:hypothetical protein